MISGEPLLKEVFAANGATVLLLYMVIIAGVLWIGFLKNHRRLESRITARLAALAREIEAEGKRFVATEGENAMQRVLCR